MTPGFHGSPTGAGWGAFSAAPHRMLFLGGAVQLLAAMMLWAAELLARAGGMPATLPFVAPAAAVHLFLMIYGTFPFFVFGFLLTVYPRWMSGPPVAPRRYVTIFTLLAAGSLLLYPAVFAGHGWLWLALALLLAAWATTLATLFNVYRTASKRGAHERLLNLALLAGMTGIAVFLYAVAANSGLAFAIAREVGLWLFLVPVVFVVSHRMIPFFSESALPGYRGQRPGWSLPLLALCVAGHAAVELWSYTQWRFVFDLPLAAAALHHTWLWNLRRSFEVRLLAMLHVAFAWFGLAMGLYALQSLALLLTGEAVLGRAPLHALGIGFVASMVVAMASRVTLGHSGRPLVADRYNWYCFLGINLAALTRLGSELAAPPLSSGLNLLAAALWLASLGAWAWRYAPMYLRPRVDGRPG